MRVDNKAVVAILRGAFHPLECTAEYNGRGFGFRFFRMEGGASIFPDAAEYGGDRLCDPEHLEAVINHWRERLQEAGYTLNPWTMPI